jgi:hypothetical protein
MSQYTSREEMEKLFSACGVELRLVCASDKDEALDFFIDDATLMIRQFAGQLYGDADLNNSAWIRIRATWIACYLISQRKGAPSLFFARYEQIIQELNMVKDGLLPIPELSTSIDAVPALSNIDHDPRFRYKTLRVQTENSTATGGSKQTPSYNFMPEWLW